MYHWINESEHAKSISTRGPEIRPLFAISGLACSIRRSEYSFNYSSNLSLELLDAWAVAEPETNVYGVIKLIKYQQIHTFSGDYQDSLVSNDTMK